MRSRRCPADHGGTRLEVMVSAVGKRNRVEEAAEVMERRGVEGATSL
jgi:hypothetical protein